MKKLFALASVFIACNLKQVNAQTNFVCTNPLVPQILSGNYNPLTYKATKVIIHPDTISKEINLRISSDTLKSTLIQLGTFYSRNTGSDTVSKTKGIGAARNWAYSKFQQYSAANGNRLLPSFFQFDQAICSFPRHRNIMSVLPGIDTTDKSVIIVEGHIDSRCAVLCDTACLAQGMDDNGSGTALVMELARVLSKYTYKNTIVFMITIGEEQGLYGANAFALYCQQNGIKIKAVFNNDVIGGIICGKTSSPPSCPGLNTIDSLQVRLFSLGGFNSPHKQLARFIKLEYKEELRSLVNVPMTLSIMTAEDRTGRGGDHQPFRMLGYTAMRFTEANENGDASNGTGYIDRQHNSRDVLGKDTKGTGIIDSFYVDVHYLSRNTTINANAISMAGIGPLASDGIITYAGSNKIRVQVTQQTKYQYYRVGVRTLTNDFDSVYVFKGKLIDTIAVPPATIYYVSIASVDSNNVESLFSKEYMINLTGIGKGNIASQPMELLQNRPNPSDEATIISVLVTMPPNYKEALIVITDLLGKEVKRLAISLGNGMNEVIYEHGYNVSGTYIYTLLIDGKPFQSKRMIFIN